MSAVDDVFESWEEMEESGALDKKLKALDVNPVEDETRNKDRNSATQIIILGDETMRSQFAPRPTVKILKRPDRNLQDGPLLNGDKPKQPIKSLKQREQEYAEARKRILGEEKSPEEKVVPEVNRIQGKPFVGSSSNNLLTNITRMPIGPDGTKGFNVRRKRDGYEAESSRLLQPPWVNQGNALLWYQEKCSDSCFPRRSFKKGQHTNDDAFVQSESE